ncbi:unnamed protein product [Amaranthus hypochondriacus]
MIQMGAFQMPRTVTISPILSLASLNSNSDSINGNPDDFLPQKPLTNSLHLSLPKPSFLVRTQSNVQIEKRRKPEPSCVVCEGSGRVDCYQCHGKGRTNYTDLSMLPKGEWPKWCKICGGSGLGHCTRCLGTGEYRDIMGFHFMKRESDHPPKHTVHQNEENAERLTAADLLLSQSLSESEK